MSAAIRREWQELADRLVAAGRFRSVDDAFAEAFRLLAAEDERYAWLKAKIDDALSDDRRLDAEAVDADLDALFADFERAAGRR